MYQWLKDGRALSPTNTSDIAWVIPHIQRSDAGDYQCIASNPYGSLLSSAAQVKVACKSYLYSSVYLVLETRLRFKLLNSVKFVIFVGCVFQVVDDLS